jgi:hypothetical protein
MWAWLRWSCSGACLRVLFLSIQGISCLYIYLPDVSLPLIGQSLVTPTPIVVSYSFCITVLSPSLDWTQTI